MGELIAEPTGDGVEVHGPFLPEWRITVGGYRVPYIQARENDDGSIEIVVDHRFTLENPVPREEFDRWIPLLANAMAVAAGYSSHGEHCVPINEFKVRMSCLGTVHAAPKLTVVDSP